MPTRIIWHTAATFLTPNKRGVTVKVGRGSETRPERKEGAPEIAARPLLEWPRTCNALALLVYLRALNTHHLRDGYAHWSAGAETGSIIERRWRNKNKAPNWLVAGRLKCCPNVNHETPNIPCCGSAHSSLFRGLNKLPVIYRVPAWVCLVTDPILPNFRAPHTPEPARGALFSNRAEPIAAAGVAEARGFTPHVRRAGHLGMAQAPRPSRRSRATTSPTVKPSCPSNRSGPLPSASGRPS
jgi:hypothetical protein